MSPTHYHESEAPDSPFDEPFGWPILFMAVVLGGFLGYLLFVWTSA